jgi:transglutaminase-like putative cysteine protease
MNYQLKHRTTYGYTENVSVSHHLLRLTPRSLPRQNCTAHEIRVLPEPTVRCAHTDYFGNTVTFLTVQGAHRSFTVESRAAVSVTAPSRPKPDETVPWDRVAAGSDPSADLHLEGVEYRFDSPLVRRHAAFSDYARASFPRDRPLLEAVLDLTSRIHADFKFDPKATTVTTPLDEFFRKRRGVCQDFAQFQIACLRSLHLPARYVSGYLETRPPPGKPKLAGADASHAWVSFWCPGPGWLDVDPTNNLQPGERHITVAWGRDFNDVSPVRGVVHGGGEHKLEVAVDVLPVTTSE